MADDIQTQLDALTARLAALEPQPRVIDPGWGERTCQPCGEAGSVTLATVVDLERPAEFPPAVWSGEGYCARHAKKYGITAGDHPHLDHLPN